MLMSEGRSMMMTPLVINHLTIDPLFQPFIIAIVASGCSADALATAAAATAFLILFPSPPPRRRLPPRCVPPIRILQYPNSISWSFPFLLHASFIFPLLPTLLPPPLPSNLLLPPLIYLCLSLFVYVYIFE